jgi:hypothetical protein
MSRKERRRPADHGTPPEVSKKRTTNYSADEAEGLGPILVVPIAIGPEESRVEVGGGTFVLPSSLLGLMLDLGDITCGCIRCKRRWQ